MSLAEPSNSFDAHLCSIMLTGASQAHSTNMAVAGGGAPPGKTCPGGSLERLKPMVRKVSLQVLGRPRQWRGLAPSPGHSEELLVHKETGPMQVRNPLANLRSVMRTRAKLAAGALGLTMTALGAGLMGTALPAYAAGYNERLYDRGT